MLEHLLAPQNIQAIVGVGVGGVAIFLYTQIQKLQAELLAHKTEYTKRLEPLEQFYRTGIRYRTLVTKSEGNKNA